MGWRDRFQKWWGKGAPSAGSLFNLNPAQARQGKLTILFLLVGIILLSLTTPQGPPSQDAASPPVEARQSSFDERGQLEERLRKILSQMAGVGDVQVLISLDGSRREYLADTREEVRRTVETDRSGGQREVIEERRERNHVLARQEGRSGEGPIIVREEGPLIRGVLVVAQGAWDPKIRLQILWAVETALGVPPHKIEVMSKR
ncbi:MAG: hypothetical protein ACOYD6_08885 [Limnochordia bacterium]|jgi:stage III sporulation protein AG